MPRVTTASILAALALAAPAQAEDIGECRFDPITLTFAGTPLEQATCLLRKIEQLAVRKPQPLPPVIVRLMREDGAPTLAQRDAALAIFPEPYRIYARDNAAQPISRTEEGLPALYFVIHDTSTPFYENDPFPRRLNEDPQVNSFTPYLDGSIARAPVAHIFLNRQGQIWAGHDFMEPWRATKLESRVVGPRARGTFRAHRNRPAAPVSARRDQPGTDRSSQTGLHQSAISDAGCAVRLCQRARRSLVDPGAAQHRGCRHS